MSSLRRYEILLPLRFNDGRPVPPELVAETVIRLREQFGAVSSQNQTIQGQFYQARRHHGEIRHHVVRSKKSAERLHDFADFARLQNQFFINALAFLIPRPGVLKSANLAGGSRAVLFLKESVVVLRGVERRVEINEVNGLILDVSLQDFEIVAVIKCAHK
jgi:hypothetical protein